MSSPSYLQNATNDELARMVTALTEELWILRDRVMTLEQVLEDADVVTVDDVDLHEPAEALDARLRRERQRVIHKVLGAPLAVAR
ncbi:hypothetical protein R4P64_32845 [Rhodococcus sp. IEGM 1366]|uniref:hypothetical protein n=1 Tax=Rhodococcus sp. IEGM 1366 TaxID=3082223 RepID=UPI0029555D41|nr:hypothetical protein [Rhodococcus sp. IEGM 1366]MDV8071305.1 hypothetical protein [Rhodococcus sp. IEGM 1366]